MSIEQYAAVHEIYRIAPEHKIPTPERFIEDMASAEFAALAETLEEQIQAELRRHNIFDSSIRSCALQTKLVHNEKDTLLINTMQDDVLSGNWTRAATALWNVLSRNNARNFRVEIRNPELMNRNAAGVARRDSPEYNALSAICDSDSIHRIVARMLPDHSSVSYQNRRKPDTSFFSPSQEPTIVIKVPPGTRAKCFEVDEEIRRAIDESTWMGCFIHYEMSPDYAMGTMGSWYPNTGRELWARTPERE